MIFHWSITTSFDKTIGIQKSLSLNTLNMVNHVILHIIIGFQAKYKTKHNYECSKWDKNLHFHFSIFLFTNKFSIG